MGRFIHILLWALIGYWLVGLVGLLLGAIGLLLVLPGLWREARREDARFEMRNFVSRARLDRLEGKPLTGLQLGMLDRVPRGERFWEPGGADVRHYLANRRR